MKKFLSLVLALVMTMSLVTISAGAKDFTDSSDINYKEAVDVMSTLKIIDGYDGGAFQPQGTLTRGAAAKIIACMMLGKTTAEALGTQAAPFKDVPVGSTFAGYIAYCVESGIIDGYADGTFRPSNKLTGFAFLKMLLTAMGYDSAIEGFTGTNWTVNVARLAIENDLTDGNSDFVGTKLATREEACLYALNTIKATLVEYENKGNSITINGAVISQGATAAKPVTSKVVSDQTINDDRTVNDDYYTVEFGEKYMPKLVLTGDQDEFMRPANTWYYKSAKIGTYAKTPDLTYTAPVTASDLYLDLGISKVDSDNNPANGYDALANAVYVDGRDDSADAIAQKAYKIEKSNTSDKFGGNGVLTEVYTSSNKVTIVEINTYVGDVTAKAAATTTRDAYVTIATRGNGNSGTFDTTDFAIDDVVLYTYSYKLNGAAYEGIQSVVKAADKLTGTLSEVTVGKKATVGGTSYDYSKKIANTADSTMLKFDVDVILDTYGYAIDIQPTNTNTAYAYVLNIKPTAGDFNITCKAELLFTDGSTKTVELTNSADFDKKFVLDKDAPAAALLDNYFDTNDNNGYVIRKGDIVKYSVSNNGKYTLDRMVAGNNDTLTQAAAPSADIKAAANPVAISNGSYQFTAFGGTQTANGKTLFLVATKTGGDTVYTVYEGIKNVPTINSGRNNVNVTVYAESGVAKIVFVDATATTTAVSTSTAIFLKPNANLTMTNNTTLGNYYTFQAIVNGEVKDDFMVSASSFAGVAGDTTNLTAARAGGMFDSVSYDKNNVATVGASVNIVTGTTTGKYYQETVTLGGTTYTYTADAWFFYLDANGVLNQITATSITDDVNDGFWAKKNAGGELTAVVVKENKNPIAGFAVAASTGLQFSTDNSTYSATLANVAPGTTVYVKADAASQSIVAAAGSPALTVVTAAAVGVQAVSKFTMPNAAVAANAYTTAGLYALNVTNVEAATNNVKVTWASVGAAIPSTATITVVVEKYVDQMWAQVSTFTASVYTATDATSTNNPLTATPGSYRATVTVTDNGVTLATATSTVFALTGV